MPKSPIFSNPKIKPVQQFCQPLTNVELESLRGGGRNFELSANGSLVWGVRSAGGVETLVGWIRTPGTEIAGGKFPNPRG